MITMTRGAADVAAEAGRLLAREFGSCRISFHSDGVLEIDGRLVDAYQTGDIFVRFEWAPNPPLGRRCIAIVPASSLAVTAGPTAAAHFGREVGRKLADKAKGVSRRPLG